MSDLDFDVTKKKKPSYFTNKKARRSIQKRKISDLEVSDYNTKIDNLGGSMSCPFCNQRRNTVEWTIEGTVIREVYLCGTEKLGNILEQSVKCKERCMGKQ